MNDNLIRFVAENDYQEVMKMAKRFGLFEGVIITLAFCILLGLYDEKKTSLKNKEA